MSNLFIDAMRMAAEKAEAAWAKAAAWEKKAKELEAALVKAEAAWVKAKAAAEAAWAAACAAEANAEDANAKSMQWQPMTNWAVFEDRKEYLLYFANDKAHYRTEVAIYLQGDAKPFACESNNYDRKMITYYALIIQPLDEQ